MNEFNIKDDEANTSQFTLIRRWYTACEQGNWELADRIWDVFQRELTYVK